VHAYFGVSRSPAYSAAKTGVVSLTKSLAIAFAEDGIRVNAIAPGWIKTEMTCALRENSELSELRNKVLARIPGGQWAESRGSGGSRDFSCLGGIEVHHRRNDLNKIRIDKCPFFNLPATGRNRWDQGLSAAEMRRCHWVRPVRVCQIKFTEWTRDDRRKLRWSPAAESGSLDA
jgi:Enoyl-(Acyl carrier protein) reductase